MGNLFRKLRADEIECRVAQVGSNYCTLLLYKDARCDMNILDETVGATNWQRKHLRDNQNCIVSIWDKEKMMWVEKEDTGTESNTEKEKGLASDSFKRACFNWGIGRELYTAPKIFVNLNPEDYTKGDKPKVNQTFNVVEIGYDDAGNIHMLKINDKKGTLRYAIGTIQLRTETQTPEELEKQRILTKWNAEKSLIGTDLNNCLVIDEVKGIWEKYPAYQKIKGFVDMINLAKDNFNA